MVCTYSSLQKLIIMCHDVTILVLYGNRVKAQVSIHLGGELARRVLSHSTQAKLMIHLFRQPAALTVVSMLLLE
jgi:hypothetical protein